MTGSAKPAIGTTGETVAENIKQLRVEKHLTYNELSAQLEAIGRAIPPLGLRRMFELTRRIDVDELTAFATVFGVSTDELLTRTESAGDDHVTSPEFGTEVRETALRCALEFHQHEGSVDEVVATASAFARYLSGNDA